MSRVQRCTLEAFQVRACLRLCVRGLFCGDLASAGQLSALCSSSRLALIYSVARARPARPRSPRGHLLEDFSLNFLHPLKCTSRHLHSFQREREREFWSVREHLVFEKRSRRKEKKRGVTVWTEEMGCWFILQSILQKEAFRLLINGKELEKDAMEINEVCLHKFDDWNWIECHGNDISYCFVVYLKARYWHTSGLNSIASVE